jgi:hypothetical protein
MAPALASRAHLTALLLAFKRYPMFPHSHADEIYVHVAAVMHNDANKVNRIPISPVSANTCV